MAHDFNNVLSIVINNLELAQQALPPNDAVQESLGDALEASLRGADLTQSLLAFARRQPLRIEPLNLNYIIISMQRFLFRVLGEDILIELDLAQDLWPVISDRSRIEASITNFATNARDAMPRGGTLTITSENRHISAMHAGEAVVRPGDYSVVTVGDSGSGMTPEISARIFEPFFTTKGPQGGTGLGLSMVFGFVKQSEGSIAVQTAPGAGTRISLFLPRSVTEVLPQEVVPATAVPGQEEIILVVEDNELLRRVVTRQVKGLGYRVLEAADASSALAVLANNAVDLLFADVIMPGGMDGIDLVRQAKAEWPQLRVLLTSGFVGRAQEEAPIDLGGAQAILRKPYRREALAQALSSALANGSADHSHAA